jgi:hypothetical protein
MTAPAILRARTVERPRLVKENVTQVVVEHGWEGITDRQAADKVRMKMRSESTPPPNAPSRTFVKPVDAAATTVASEPVMAPTAPVPPTAPAVAQPVRKFIPVPIITPTPRPTVAATAAPASHATATVAPLGAVPSASPANAAKFSSPSPSASVAASLFQPPLPRSGEVKEQRSAEKELRKQQRTIEPARKFIPNEGEPTVTPTPRPSVTATAAPGSHGEHLSQTQDTLTTLKGQKEAITSGAKAKESEISDMGSSKPAQKAQEGAGTGSQTSPAAGATASPSSPAANNSPNELPPKRGKFQSEALKHNPRLVVPLTSPAPSSSPAATTGAASPAATAAPESSPAGELSRPEERKQRRREQRGGTVEPGAASSPSAAPQ